MQYLKLTDIKLNPENPRIIKDDKFKKLVESLKSFPEMANVRPVVVNKEHVILGGNMRFRAMQAAGWDKIPVEIVDWPEEKQREFVIKDNVNVGEWDWDVLANEWSNELLSEWGLLAIGDISKVNLVNGDNNEWVGMPEFEGRDEPIKLIIQFENESTRQSFVDNYQIEVSTKGEKYWTTWYPPKERDDLTSVKYE